MKKIILALSVLAFVTACTSKKKTTDVIETGGIEESEARFDPMGSDSGKIPGLSTVNFEYDQFSLTSEARNKLQANADWIKNNKGTTVQIEGHCDSNGSIEYNLTLGDRRANAVKSFLVSSGVDENQLSVISYGEEKPLAMGDDATSHAQNRRANFVPIQ